MRRRVRFTIGLEGLLLELGDYFHFNWTRNQGPSDPYTDSIFQVEGLALDCARNVVEVEALWRDDLRTDKPYLLDDENFLTRFTPQSGDAIIVTDGDPQVQCVNWAANSEAGVLGGDILLLKDSTQAEDVYTRYRAVRIADVPGDSAFTLDTSDLDFDAPTGITLDHTKWLIKRGSKTMPTSSEDPTNYPDGADMYGRCANTASGGTYGDGAAAHKLLEG